MKKRTVIIALAVVLVSAFFLSHIPRRIDQTMTVSSGSGEPAEVDIHVLYFPNLVLPSYVKGTVSVDGIAYTDQYTMLKKFPGVSDNRLFPSDWWRIKESIPCNATFLKSDCRDVISARLNRINVLDVVWNQGICKIHYMLTDESNQIGTTIPGISFWGPARNAEEAKQIAASLGYKNP